MRDGGPQQFNGQQGSTPPKIFIIAQVRGTRSYRLISKHIVLFAGVAFCISGAYCEEEDATILELPTKVITATRSAENTQEISRPVSVVGKEDLTARAPKTSAEALREEPGLSVQKTGHGGGSANIRGMSSNQILLLVDGIRLNNSVYRLGNHQYLTTVDPNMIEQIEIVRGPHSVLYGSDALGGVIHLITKASEFGADQKPLSLSLSGRGAMDLEKPRAFRRGKFQALPSLKIRASAENLLDFNYREHGSGLNAPGRNFIIGAEYSL